MVRSPDEDGVGVIGISAKDETTFYAVHEIPCEIGGRGFAVHRLGLGTLYHVRVASANDCSCECMGFLRHGRCKHTQGLLALIRQKKL